MTFSLYYSPYELMEKYLRMSNNGMRRNQIIKILAELNAVSKDSMEQIINLEQTKINQIGLEEYRMKHHHVLSDGKKHTCTI